MGEQEGRQFDKECRCHEKHLLTPKVPSKEDDRLLCAHVGAHVLPCTPLAMHSTVETGNASHTDGNATHYYGNILTHMVGPERQ